MADEEKQAKHPNLLKGGRVGNAGGTGRPPNILREKARGNHELALMIMRDELKKYRKLQNAGKDFPMSRVIEIGEHCGKFGIGSKVEVEQPPVPVAGPMTFEEAERRAKEAMQQE